MNSTGRASIKGLYNEKIIIAFTVSRKGYTERDIKNAIGRKIDNMTDSNKHVMQTTHMKVSYVCK